MSWFHPCFPSNGHILELMVQPLDLQQIGRLEKNREYNMIRFLFKRTKIIHYSNYDYLDRDRLQWVAQQPYFYPSLQVEVVRLPKISSSRSVVKYTFKSNLIFFVCLENLLLLSHFLPIPSLLVHPSQNFHTDIYRW